MFDVEKWRPLVDLLEKYGINPVFVVIIIALVAALKKADSSRRMKAKYVFLPFIVGFVVCWIGIDLTMPIADIIASWISRTLIHGGLAIAGYMVWDKSRKKKVN